MKQIFQEVDPPSLQQLLKNTNAFWVETIANCAHKKGNKSSTLFVFSSFDFNQYVWFRVEHWTFEQIDILHTRTVHTQNHTLTHKHTPYLNSNIRLILRRYVIPNNIRVDSEHTFHLPRSNIMSKIFGGREVYKLYSSYLIRSKNIRRRGGRT